MQRLKQITTRGGVYLGLRYGFGILISMGNMLVLTWWIGPHAYGLFVTALGLCISR
jgi:O-antigen/teichoic acid export membrane protein